MAFVLADDPDDLVHELESAEAQAPKAIKPLLAHAARRLQSCKETAALLAETLEEAARLRAGAMATQSRCEEIEREVRARMLDVANRLRILA